MGGEPAATVSSGTDEKWLDACIHDERLHPIIRAKLLARQTEPSEPCTNFYLQQDSCRNRVTCTQPFFTLPCHPSIHPPQDASDRQWTAELREARASDRRTKADTHEQKPRRRNYGFPGSLMRSIENGLHAEDLPGRAHALPNTGDQPARENKSPEIGPVSSSGDGDRVKPDIQELLANTTHQMDTSHAKRWVCKACNEQKLIALSRNLEAFLKRPCKPGPPPWMHPTHEYTRDTGKISCNVCFGFSTGLRSTPKLSKPCSGPAEASRSHYLGVSMTKPRSRPALPACL